MQCNNTLFNEIQFVKTNKYTYDEFAVLFNTMNYLAYKCVEHLIGQVQMSRG